eukprot:TRINITY_DN11447_c7_g1_i3.p1 TRINITY_DN11447_c7_g1~~TRINITY_DN11447_c7_g1_i3.p1  ORF type:complete len:764 (+),score=146.65 TRINITY_DN11447_c7_g1_i3:37-2292(+)
MAETYEVVLFVLGLIAFLVLGAVVYYMTGDDYKLRKKRKELGYEVDSWSDTLKICCALCLGPMNRSRWEKKHKYFRTEDYGKPDKHWMKNRPASEPNQEWQKLPRGDVSVAKTTAGKVFAKTQAIIAQEMYEECLAILAQEMQTSNIERSRTMIKRYKAKPARDLEATAAKDEAASKRLEHETAATITAAIDEASVTPNVTALATQAATNMDLFRRNIDFKAVANPTPLNQLSHPHNRTTLSATIKNMTSGLWRKEYRTMPLNLEVKAVHNPRHEQYNRDPRMLPNLPTAIKLSNMSGYINANAIRGPNKEPMKYIATQAPLTGREHGRKSTLTAFWAMVWEYQVPAIVMLIEPQGHRSPRYWPVPEGVVHHGPYSIRHGGFEKRKGYLVTKLIMTNGDDKHSHTLSHYCLSGWPEHKVPSKAKFFLNLVHECRTVLARYTKPIVVHCDRGFGPTGVLLSLLRVIEEYKQTGQIDCLKAVASTTLLMIIPACIRAAVALMVEPELIHCPTPSRCHCTESHVLHLHPHTMPSHLTLYPLPTVPHPLALSPTALRQDRGALVESLGEYHFLHRCAVLYLDHEASLNPSKPNPKQQMQRDHVLQHRDHAAQHHDQRAQHRQPQARQQPPRSQQPAGGKDRHPVRPPADRKPKQQPSPPSAQGGHKHPPAGKAVRPARATSSPAQRDRVPPAYQPAPGYEGRSSPQHTPKGSAASFTSVAERVGAGQERHQGKNYNRDALGAAPPLPKSSNTILL